VRHEQVAGLDFSAAAAESGRPHQFVPSAGFAAVRQSNEAVDLRLGTELAFENGVRRASTEERGPCRREDTTVSHTIRCVYYLTEPRSPVGGGKLGSAHGGPPIAGSRGPGESLS
jgi:hypothetical protein